MKANQVLINNILYEIDNKTITASVVEIKGIGDIFIPYSISVQGKNYIITSINQYVFGIFNDNKQSITSLNFVVGSEVCDIGNCCLPDSLRSFHIPKNISVIKENWFSEAKSLVDIEISSKNKNFIFENGLLLDVKKERIFVAQKSQEEFLIPSSVKIICNHAFAYCNCKTIKFETNSSLETISEAAFACSALSHISLPPSVRFMNKICFYGKFIEYIECSSPAIHIASKGIKHCCNLKSITLPKVIYLSVELSSFRFNSENFKLIIPKTSTIDSEVIKFYHINFIPNTAFFCTFHIVHQKNIVLRDDIFYQLSFKRHQNYAKAIYYNKDSQYIFIPSSLSCNNIKYNITEIGALFYSGEDTILTLTVPDDSKLETIHQWAFNLNCFTKIKIPPKLTNFKQLVRFLCEHEYNIDVEISPQNHFFRYENGLLLDREKTQIFFAQKNFKTFIIPSTVKTIHKRAFYNSFVKTILFEPNSSLKNIKCLAFENCKYLSQLSLPPSLRFLDWGCFFSSGIESIECDSPMISLSGNIFCECQNIKSVKFPKLLFMMAEDDSFDVETKDFRLFIPEGAIIPNKIIDPNKIEYIENKSISKDERERVIQQIEFENRKKNEERERRIGELIEENRKLREKNEEMKIENEMLLNENGKLRNKLKSIENNIPQYQEKAKENFYISNSEILKYEKKEKIGRGSSSKVDKVYKEDKYFIEYQEKHFYAMKKIEVPDLLSKQHFLREVEIHQQLKHPTILKFYGYNRGFYCQETQRTYFPSLLLSYQIGTLEDQIHHLNDTEKVIIIIELILGLRYFQEKCHLIHRDLKPRNILLNSHHHCHLSDFGSSIYYYSNPDQNQNTNSISKFDSNHINNENANQKENEKQNENDTMTRGVGTLQYMAPEMLKEEKNYTSKIDQYSFGLVVYFILMNGQHPQRRFEELFKEELFHIPEEIVPFARELISRCCSFDPSKRPTFSEIFTFVEKHHFSFFSDIDYHCIKTRLCYLLYKERINESLNKTNE